MSFNKRNTSFYYNDNGRYFCELFDQCHSAISVKHLRTKSNTVCNFSAVKALSKSWILNNFRSQFISLYGSLISEKFTFTPSEQNLLKINTTKYIFFYWPMLGLSKTVSIMVMRQAWITLRTLNLDFKYITFEYLQWILLDEWEGHKLYEDPKYNVMFKVLQGSQKLFLGYDFVCVWKPR